MAGRQGSFPEVPRFVPELQDSVREFQTQTVVALARFFESGFERQQHSSIQQTIARVQFSFGDNQSFVLQIDGSGPEFAYISKRRSLFPAVREVSGAPTQNQDVSFLPLTKFHLSDSQLTLESETISFTLHKKKEGETVVFLVATNSVR